jgi:lipoprotein-releasing system permease protein
VLGIGTGVLALTVILAVMNGFQMGFIESILEVSSFHLRLEKLSPGTEETLGGELLRLSGISSVLPFREFQAMIRGRRGTVEAAVIRGLPPKALERDRGLAGRLTFEEGSFDLLGPQTILLGAELARRLGLKTGDELSLLSLSGPFPENLSAGDSRFTLTGVFRTGFYEYDLGWGFINLETAGELEGPAAPAILGIKLRNRWQDERIRGEIEQLLASRASPLEDPAAPALSSWRDYNRAFFGALRTEKLLMFTLVGLIFIVVGLNIFQAQRRIVLERREEIGLLRALGASDFSVRLVFVWDGFIIGLSGAGGGMALGLLIAGHIQAFFSLLEGLVNFFIGLLNGLSELSGFGPGAGEFAVFSPRIFYLKEIPSRLIPHEVVLIFMFGFLSALLAAWFASGKVSRTRPAEVLRYE